MMDFKEFKREITKELEKTAGIGSVKILDIVKNNGVCRTGVVISRPPINVSPTVYLEEYYKELPYKAVEEIAEEIWTVYLDNTLNERMDISSLTEWDSAKDRIVIKLVNYAANEELLQQLPYDKFLNLAVVYQYILYIDGVGAATFLIHNCHLEMWGVEKAALQEVAYKNYKKFYPTLILNMKEMISELFGQIPFEWKDDKECPQIPIYIATNRMKLHGAAVMLFPEELKVLSDKWETDLYSSVFCARNSCTAGKR